MQDEATKRCAFAPSTESHCVWKADPVHLTHIRALTLSWLEPLGMPADTEYDVLLAVDEAVSNAIEHAYVNPGPADVVVVRFWTEPDHVNFHVADHGRWKAASDAGHRGHGIPLMRQMIDSVVVQHDVDGTRVLLRHAIAW